MSSQFCFPPANPFAAPMQQKRKRSCSISYAPAADPQRTQKRWRSNRPTEETVHQYTLQKLFTAAKHLPPSSSPTVKPAFQNQHQYQPPQPALMRSAFAMLGRAGKESAVQMVNAQCEDCERGFVAVGGEEGCLGCGRVVCEMGCSASNGEGRVCLECVMR